MSKVRLGDVAIEVRETSKCPEGLPVVGLEHLLPSEITLTQWSDTSDNTFNKLFHKGQILFGRRRAYLKKAAVAPFDGVCSGDITVIAAKPERLLTELLPFIIRNDAFFDYAMEKSAGSLSPRVKWAQLAEYEFDLPELEEQQKLANLLWAMERTRKAYQDLLIQADELVKSQFVEMFGDPILTEKDETLTALSDSCILKAGKFIKADDISDTRQDGQYPCFGGNGIRGYVSQFNQEGERPLIGRQGALCGNVQYATGRFYATEHAVVVTPKGNDINTLWLYYLLQHLKLERYATGAAQPGIAVNKLEQIRVSIPGIMAQTRFSRFARETDKSKLAIRQALESLEKSRSAIMTKVFG